jgi:hypothetical protein
MKSIIYRESIQIEKHEHVVFEIDYSESINELIKDNILSDCEQDIIDYITDDIVNNYND